MAEKRQRRSVLGHWRVVAARLKDTERQVDVLLAATTCYASENHPRAAETARQAFSKLSEELDLVNKDMKEMESEILLAQKKVGFTKCIFTRGQFWPSGIVIGCVCVSVCLDWIGFV